MLTLLTIFVSMIINKTDDHSLSFLKLIIPLNTDENY